MEEESSKEKRIRKNSNRWLLHRSVRCHSEGAKRLKNLQDYSHLGKMLDSSPDNPPAAEGSE